MDRLILQKLNEENLSKLEAINFEISPRGNRKLKLGQQIIFRESVKVGVSFGIYSGNCIPSIGSYSFSHSSFSELIPFSIGNYVSIGEGVSSFGFEHPLDNLGTSPIFYQKDRNLFKQVNIITSNKIIQDKEIVIGNDVWIGRNVMIKRGVTVGNGAVLGAGAIVTKNIPEFAVVGGNPARIIKYRFNQEIIDRLNLINWWDLPSEELTKINFNWPITKIIDTLEELNSIKNHKLLDKVLLIDLLGIKV